MARYGWDSAGAPGGPRKAEPGAGSAGPGAAQRRRLTRSLKDYSAKNRLRIELLAPFDRAAARDFADVYVLAHRFGKEVLLARAAQIDSGFDAKVLAGMFATLDQFTDDEIPVPDVRSRTANLLPILAIRTRTVSRNS